MHMKVLDRFTKDGGLKPTPHKIKPESKQAVKEGFASFSVWPDWCNSRQTVIYL